jgi:hypothetical protein
VMVVVPSRGGGGGGRDIASRLAERQSMVITPLPFTSSWYRNAVSSSSSFEGGDVRRACIDDDNDADVIAM